MKDKELLDYWLILYRRKWLIFFVMAAAVATSVAYSFFMPEVYQSKAVFFIPRHPDVVSFLTPDEQSLKRSPLLPEIAEEPHSPYMGLLKSKALRVLVQRDFPNKTINDLRSDVDFSLSNEYMIQVYARDYDPVNAAGIANSYVKYLNQLIDSYSKSLTGRRETNIEQEIEGMKIKLNSARQQLKEFQEKSSAVALGEKKAQLVSLKMKLESEVDANKVALHENTTKIAALKQQIAEEEKLISSADFSVTSPLLEKLRMDLVNVEVNMAVKRTEIRESHPDFILLKNQYDRLKENISAEIERIVKSQIKKPDTFYETIRRQLVNLFIDQQRIKARQEAYAIVIGSIAKKINEIPGLLIQEDVLATEVTKYKKIVQTLEMNLQEAEMQKERDPQNVVLVEEATPSESPSFPILWLNILVAAVVGMIGGVFYAFFIDYLEETKEQRIFKLVKAIEASERED